MPTEPSVSRPSVWPGRNRSLLREARHSLNQSTLWAIHLQASRGFQGLGTGHRVTGVCRQSESNLWSMGGSHIHKHTHSHTHTESLFLMGAWPPFLLPSPLVQKHFKQFLHSGASLVDQMIKRLPAVQETWVWSLGREDPLEKEMATHSSILAWRIPWTEEPGGLQSM